MAIANIVPMIRKKDSNKLNVMINVGMVCALIIIICMGVALVKSVVSPAAAFIVMGLCIVMLFVLFFILKRVKDEVTYLSALMENLHDLAFIKYNSKKDTAALLGDVALLTGIDVGSDTLSGESYKQLIQEIISSKFDMEDDIYMSCCPEKWIRVNSFTDNNYECTVIRDVSKYVSNMNLIKSLRYYDTGTGVLSKEAFSHKLRQAAENKKDMIGLIHIIISGIDKVLSFSGTASADHAVMRIAAFLRKYENPHNAFAGITSSNEFTLAITDTYEVGCRKIAEKVYTGICHTVAELPENERTHIRIYCGYALFDKDETSVGGMMAAVDFAAFDAERQNAARPIEYNPVSYANSAHEFKKIQVFNEIVEKNLIDYHFQPIVNARTGEIYGYESLMRPQAIDGIKLSPLEMLSIAENQDMLGEIENRTLFNSLKILSENQDFFRDRKMFVNSIPSNTLSDIEYETLYNNYGELFDKLVVEITESTKISEATIKLLDTRFKKRKARVALDDYGTGYSNESTLISVYPDFVKIDRSIVSGIDSDPQKQHLVSNMISFASQQGIKTLAEGIETNEELETVISLGIDLIQGFVACKAMSILMLDIPADVRSSIVTYNLKHTGYVAKTYEIVNDTPVDIVNLVLFGYTEIVVRNKVAYIKGEIDKEVSMRIKCESGTEPTVHFQNVNITGLEAPVLTLGKNCTLMAVMEGDNIFSYEGIRVPGSAKFVLQGDGNLTVDCSHNNGIAIGGNAQQEIGQIVLNGTGKVSVKSKGDNCIGIGGGSGNAKSLISIVSGEIDLNVKGASVLGIGTISGEIEINLNSKLIKAEFAGQNVIGIGSKNGHVNIDNNSEINFTASGDNCCLIGVFDKGSGNIRLNSKYCKLIMRAKNCVGIGAVNGNVETIFNSGVYDILGEGNKAKCIGDFDGSGYVRISNVVINAVTHSSEETNIGIGNGKVIISGGNIHTNSIVDINAYSPYGTKLERYKVIDAENEFNIVVKEDDEVYKYTSEPNELVDGNYVYLPEGFRSELVEIAEVVG